MQLSDDLPTAVDYTNILVNYVEVSADDIPKGPAEENKVPEGVYPPLVLHHGTEAKDHAPDSVRQPHIVEGEPPIEPIFWGKEVPKYLHDVDVAEHTQHYQRAAKGVHEFATPPGLPLFLGKSILNGTTPMKDDSSVLNMPNHTVLNHLATSSIKNEVLATSITTRYRRKVSLSTMPPIYVNAHLCLVRHHDCLQTDRVARLKDLCCDTCSPQNPPPSEPFCVV